MKPVTASEMRKIDRFTIKKIGIPAIVLMENAGRGVFLQTQNFAGPVGHKKIVVVAGKGGNGGDALVAARWFFKYGAGVEIFLVAPEKELSSETFSNFRVVKNLGIKINPLNVGKLPYFRKTLQKSDLFIDGIFGFGFKGEVTGVIGEAVKIINDGRRQNSLLKVIAIDCPSGLEATSGRASKNTVAADLTVTLGIPKAGLLKSSARKFVGILKVIDIGLFTKITGKNRDLPDYSEIKEIARLLPRRTFDVHKAQAGRMLVIAGSKNMSGAAMLTAIAGLRTGSGLVSLVVPESLQKIIAPRIPEIITFGISETNERTFASAGAGQIRKLLDKCEALAIGPGLTTQPETQKFFMKFLEIWLKNFSRKPLVIDADGLNILSLNFSWFQKFIKKAEKKKAPLILTPHAGEFSRLTGWTASAIEKNREKTAAAWAKKTGIVLVLKGARTVIASPKGEIFINSSGSPVLATAGSGDVLTGIIGSLLSQKLPPLNAVRAGVFLHGLAGEIAEKGLGPRGLKAGDIAENLPAAYNVLLK